jgi:hypothetical protein
MKHLELEDNFSTFNKEKRLSSVLQNLSMVNPKRIIKEFITPTGHLEEQIHTV